MSAITVHSIMGDRNTIERGKVYKTLGKNKVNPIGFDAKLANIENGRRVGIAVGIISAIALVITLAIKVQSPYIFGAEVIGMFAGLSMFAYYTLKKHDHLNEELDADQVNEMLEDLKKGLKRETNETLNSERVQGAIRHATRIAALNKRILPDLEMQDLRQEPKRKVASRTARGSFEV